MVGWECAECGSSNDVNHHRCQVCNAHPPEDAGRVRAPGRPASAAPVAEAPAPDRAAQVRRLLRPVAVPLVLLIILLGYALVTLVDLPFGGADPTARPPGPQDTTVPDDGLDDGVDDGLDVTTPEPTSTGASSPSGVGVVAVDPEVAHEQTADVAALFDTHFDGINSGRYADAVAVFDPAGVIDPTSAAARARFQREVSTTTDDDIVLRDVRDDLSGLGALEARVTFRSRQRAGYGPPSRRDETCTRWDVTYVLTGGPPTAYRLLRSSSAESRPC